MLKKILIQIFLIIVLIGISILFYFKYIDKSDQTDKVDKIKDEIVGSEDTKGNVISNINYESHETRN